jgi:integrase
MKTHRRGVVRWRMDIGKYIIDYYDNLGKRHREVIGDNEDAATTELAKRIVAIGEGTFDLLPKTEIFKNFAERWIKGKIEIEDSTRVSYEGILENHLIPYFGNGKIAEIKRQNIQEFVGTLREKGLSSKSIDNILKVLHQIFEDAEIENLIIRNPYLKIEKPKRRKPPVDYLRTREISIFLEACTSIIQGKKIIQISKEKNPGDKKQGESINHYALFYTDIFTGMRRGELLARKWADIDWINRKIHVGDSLYKGKFKTPKSEYSVRNIDMGPRLIQILKDHRAVQNKVRLAAGKDWIDNDLIFCQNNGKPLDPDNLYHRDFKRILKRAGLRSIQLHSLRHTFAAILISAGHSLKYIQNQMGHSSIQVTMDLYGHLMPEIHERAAEKTEDFVFCPVIGPENEKGVTADSQPLDLIGSGG